MTTSEKTTTEQSCGSVWMNGPDRVYLVKSSGVCVGCVFAIAEEGIRACPRTPYRALACLDVKPLVNSIFITEVEYLKRQMR